MDYMSNSTAQPETEDAEYEKTEISFGEQKNRAEISNQAAFALNEFGMQRMETLDEGKRTERHVSFLGSEDQRNRGK